MSYFKSILLALDGSPHSLAALDVACSIAGERGGRIVAVHASSPVPHLHGHHIDWRNDDSEENRAAVRIAREASERAAREPRLAFEPHIMFGEPAGELLAAATRFAVDTIVIGARGCGGFEALLIGSVADAVVKQARVPVLVVHRDAGA